MDETQVEVVLERMRGSFLAGFAHGTYLAESGFQHVWYGNEADDWAIVKLKKPIGIELGWITVSNFTDPLEMVSPDPLYHMYAYSMDKYTYELGLDPDCALLEYAVEDDSGAQLFVTSCSGEAGASGASILNEDDEVVAVFVSAVDQTTLPKVRVIDDFDPRYPNFATPASTFYETYINLPGIADIPEGDDSETDEDQVSGSSDPSAPPGDEAAGGASHEDTTIDHSHSSNSNAVAEAQPSIAKPSHSSTHIKTGGKRGTTSPSNNGFVEVQPTGQSH